MMQWGVATNLQSISLSRESWHFTPNVPKVLKSWKYRDKGRVLWRRSPWSVCLFSFHPTWAHFKFSFFLFSFLFFQIRIAVENFRFLSHSVVDHRCRKKGIGKLFISLPLRAVVFIWLHEIYDSPHSPALLVDVTNPLLNSLVLFSRYCLSKQVAAKHENGFWLRKHVDMDATNTSANYPPILPLIWLRDSFMSPHTTKDFIAMMMLQCWVMYKW